MPTTQLLTHIGMCVHNLNMDTRQRYRATGLSSVLDDQGRKRAWLARTVGVSHSLIQMIESGQRTASPDVADRIASAMGVPMAVIFAGTESCQQEDAS